MHDIITTICLFTTSSLNILSLYTHLLVLLSTNQWCTYIIRRAHYIHRQSSSLTGYHRLTLPSVSAISQHPSRQFHTAPHFDTSAGGQTNKMRDDAKASPVSSSNWHLETSIAEDPSSRHIHEDDSWKLRAPYRIQKDDEFGPVKWEAMCHCGNVQYQIKQERPLAAKYCHCRACQVLHGIPPSPERSQFKNSDMPRSCTIPMVRHLPQNRHSIQTRHRLANVLLLPRKE